MPLHLFLYCLLVYGLHGVFCIHYECFCYWCSQSQQNRSLVASHSSMTQYIHTRPCKWKLFMVGPHLCQICPFLTLHNTHHCVVSLLSNHYVVGPLQNITLIISHCKDSELVIFLALCAFIHKVSSVTYVRPPACLLTPASYFRNYAIHNCSFQSTVTFNVAKVLQCLRHDNV